MDKGLILRRSFISILASALILSGFAENDMESRSRIDWTANVFTSSVTLNIDKAGIPMPSGKMTAVNRITTELPELIKDPLLSLRVNSESQLSDYVLSKDISLEQVFQIVNTSRRTPGIFVNSSPVIQVEHTLDTLRLSSLLIRHKYPYRQPSPIEIEPSRAYTGIIIDARGSLPVHGEFTKDSVYPCFFPQIWDENMNLIYERNMENPETAAKEGFVLYGWQENMKEYIERIGNDPLYISARKVYGRFRTDPVISRKDALKILSVKENMDLLREGKVVVLLDKDNLIADVAVPEKTKEYYAAIKELKQHLFTPEETPVIQDTARGIQILYDLKFVADSAELLDSELPKIKSLAESLKRINADNAYTILVEGHTADVNKPEGQMRLSIERTQTIINELVANGLDRSLFSYRGYGGTQPVATNSTPEGRAQNRRVIITARPKATYIQRN